jgi:ribosome biogenesis GTPase
MHTTTTSRLFHLAGFDLIDSPGIREFGLGHISPQQVFDGFVELRALAGQCKFRDCAHQGEPDYALQAAVEAGTIHEDRLSSYFQILDSL